MNHQSFTSSIVVDRSPKDVFNAINDIRGWWSEDFKGNSHHLNDEFEVRFGDVHYSRQKLTELVPDKKIVWLVTDSRLNFLKNKSEWTGTQISFDISRRDTGTEIRFTHTGLVPEIECFDACSNAWSDYLKGSLVGLITDGKGKPNQKEG